MVWRLPGFTQLVTYVGDIRVWPTSPIAHMVDHLIISRKMGPSGAPIPFSKPEVFLQGELKELLTALQPGSQSRNGMYECTVIVWGPSQRLLERAYFPFILVMQMPANIFRKEPKKK